MLNVYSWFLDLCALKTFLDLKPSDNEFLKLKYVSLVSMMVMFMFAQLISRPELTFLMKSGYVSVIRVSGPKNSDI